LADARKAFYEAADAENLISSPKHDHMEKVISPKHYVGKGMEVIDIIDAFDLNAYEANIIKYVLRHKKKEGVICLRKAKWYLDRMIEKFGADD